jgi:hypothetical protein
VRRRLLGPVLTVAVVVSSGLAHAQDQDAQALFDEGLANMKAGRFKLGCALIKRSLDVDARPGTAFTLAECYSRAGKFASAVSFYDHFLATFEAMPKEQQEQQQARADISRAERTRLIAQVAWLTVILPPLVAPGAVVTLDGEDFPSSLFGIATAIDPGPHVFTTAVPGGPLIEQRVEIAAGERKSMTLEVRNPAAQQPTLPPEQRPPDAGKGRHSNLTPWMWTSFGVGAAGLITGTVSGILLLQDRAKIKEHCHPEQAVNGVIPCDEGSGGYEASQRAQNTLAPLTTVALSVGAAGVVAGVLLLVFDSNGSNQAGSRTIPLVALEPRGGTVGFVTPW